MQTQYPLIATKDEAIKIESVEQRCIFQVIVNPLQMAKNIKAMNDNFKRFIAILTPADQQVFNRLAGFVEDNKETETNEDDTIAENK